MRQKSPKSSPKVPQAKTGWPPGLMQDDCRGLFEWLAGRLGARYVLRANLPEPPTAASGNQPKHSGQMNEG